MQVSVCPLLYCLSALSLSEREVRQCKRGLFAMDDLAVYVWTAWREGSLRHQWWGIRTPLTAFEILIVITIGSGTERTTALLPIAIFCFALLLFFVDARLTSLLERRVLHTTLIVIQSFSVLSSSKARDGVASSSIQFVLTGVNSTKSLLWLPTFLLLTCSIFFSDSFYVSFTLKVGWWTKMCWNKQKNVKQDVVAVLRT